MRSVPVADFQATAVTEGQFSIMGVYPYRVREFIILPGLEEIDSLDSEINSLDDLEQTMECWLLQVMLV